MSELPWSVLNSFPLDSLVKYCQTSKSSYSICSQPQYLQQRFRSHGGDVSLFQNSPFRLPIERYVHAMAISHLTSKDPSVLEYMSKSNIMFPGLEYYIGLGTMGLRAIHQNSSGWLVYVLRRYPSKSELTDILNIVNFLNLEAEANHVGFTLLPSDILSRVNYIFSDMNPPYYPGNIGEYSIYVIGLNGVLLDLSKFDWDNGRSYLPYVFGLINGQHVVILTFIYTRIGPNILTNPMVIEQIMLMDKTPHSGPLFSLFTDYIFPASVDKYSLLSLAVKTDNVKYANAIFSVTGNVIPLITAELWIQSNLIPRSLEMLKTFDTHHQRIPRENIVHGALISGSYELFNTLSNKDLSMFVSEIRFYLSSVASAPFEMIRLLLSVDVDIDPESIIVQELARMFVGREDFFRLENLLSLFPKAGQRIHDISGMFDNVAYQAFGSDRPQYPILFSMSK